MSTSAENDSSDVIEWFPGAILQEGRPGPNGAIIRDEFALVVLNQPLETQLGLLYTLWDNGMFFLGFPNHTIPMKMQ